MHISPEKNNSAHTDSTSNSRYGRLLEKVRKRIPDTKTEGNIIDLLETRATIIRFFQRINAEYWISLKRDEAGNLFWHIELHSNSKEYINTFKSVESGLG